MGFRNNRLKNFQTIKYSFKRKKHFNKKMRTPSRKSSQIYWSLSEAIMKATLCKKLKNTKMFTVTHVILVYTISKLPSSDF